MSRFRPFAAWAAVVVAVGALAPRDARAEEEPPVYDASSMKLAADALPEGWKLVEGASDVGGDQREAIHAAVVDAAKEAGTETPSKHLVSIDAGGRAATVALVDVG